MALLLRKHGITRVRPLAGGYGAWRERGYPVDRIAADWQSTEALRQE